MAFLALANEIIIIIVEYLESQGDINSVSMVNRRFHDLFDDYLYRYNIQFRQSSALIWAAKKGRESTARKLLHLGADIDTKLQKSFLRPHQLNSTTCDRTKAHLGVIALHMAAWNGHLAIVKLLLDVGSDPEARTVNGRTPLYAALARGHEKIGRTIYRRISNPHNCFVDSEEGLTPLHMASHFGLSNCARFFLEEGADIHTTDRSGRTALYHALESNYNDFDWGDYSSHYVMSNYVLAPSSDKIFDTVMVLREFGANPDLESAGGIPSRESARELGVRHPYRKVRELFESNTGVPLYKPDRLHIGRTWMVLSKSEISQRESDGSGLRIDISNSFVSQHHSSFHSRGFSSISGRDSDNFQRPRNVPDVEPFPVLVNTRAPNIFHLRTHQSDGPWSPLTIGRLIDGFSVSDEPKTPPTPEATAQVEPFPQLSNHSSSNHLDAVAKNLWANFGKPKSSPVAEDVSINCAADEQNTRSRSKRGKARGKGRWQALQL